MIQLAQATCQHTPRDLRTYGERYGIDYRFPTLAAGAAHRAPVIRGRIRELAPARGMQVVASDIEVLQRYDSRSRRPTPLSIIVMLEGQAEVRLGQQRLGLTGGMALSVTLDAQQGLQATQPPGQRIRALTLALDAPRLAELGAALPFRGSSMHVWTLPPLLQQALEQALSSPLSGAASNLQWEGLGLQLLAHGLPHDAGAPCARVPPGERQRLERIRRQLHEHPAQPHSLTALAEQAAMSPATLRRKFQAAFGCSVFDYLRDRRLDVASEALLQGSSVEQAAHLAGYHHASNLASAFRRRFGYSPSSLRHCE